MRQSYEPFAIILGSITFHVRKRPVDAYTRKRKKKQGQFMYDSQGQPVLNDGGRMPPGPPIEFNLIYLTIGFFHPVPNDAGLLFYGPKPDIILVII